jgi:hypothetical protein
MRIILVLFLACSMLRADPLAGLKSALARLDGRDSVKARVECQSWVLDGDANKPEDDGNKATALVEDGPEGLRIAWSRALVGRAAEEGNAQARDPDRKTPIRRAMDVLNATRLNSYLNAAPELLTKLEEAQLIEEKNDTWEGQPVRRLTFKVNPRLNERSRKVIKEIDATARVWIGADGLPVAAENRVRLKGRILLVVTFESVETEEFRFGHTAGRLVVVRHVRETKGSGGGESNHQKTIATVALTEGSPDVSGRGGAAAKSEPFCRR